jgi:hypothetical protein
MRRTFKIEIHKTVTYLFLLCDILYYFYGRSLDLSFDKHI